jgi:tripartite-type tricarboxylate transporter receptor subunit TctC
MSKTIEELIKIDQERRSALNFGMKLGVATIAASYGVQEAFGQNQSLAPLPPNWPNKPIKLIVPFPPGNTLDIVARFVQTKMSQDLGQSVYIENIGGAYAQIGMAAIARANPDGYTFGASQGGPMVVQPHTVKNLPYDVLRDFIPVAVSAWNYNALAGSLSAPFKTLSEMVTWARANPGKLTVGTTGEGGFAHLWFEDFRRQAKFEYTHVPYKGTANIASDLVSGAIMAGADGISGFAGLAKGEKIRIVAITNSTKVEQWPSVSLLSDAVPGFVVNGWFGFVAPAKTPMAIVNRLNQAINAAMKSPEVQEKLPSYGLIGVTESAEYFDQLNRKDYERYGTIVKAIGLEAK